MIELKDIDTSVAEHNIVQLFKKNETYFLNGEWGSGKTVFLEKVYKEILPTKPTILRLWELKDERTVIEIAFSQLHRRIYWSLKVIVVLAVVISILMSPLINLGLSQYFQKFANIAVIISLVVTVWQFFKYKSDNFYYYIFSKFPIKNKILVVDDFDRISSQKQEELFRLFNILKDKLPIIFVGDFSKVSQSEGEYLKKIIDKRIELPIVLHPKYIWHTYFDDLSQHLEYPLSSEFINIFIAEKRNLRDRKQFNELLNQELSIHGKLYHVQIEQQLTLIYLYLFYPDKYQVLRNGGMLEHSESYQKYLNEKKEKNQAWAPEPEKTVDDLFILLLADNDQYPSSFIKNRETYLLYEAVSNLSTKEANQILKNEELLNQMFLGEDANFNDFYLFITSNYADFDNEKQSYLVRLALKFVEKNKKNRLIEYVITQKSYDIIPPKIFIGSSNGVTEWSIPDEWGDKSEEEVKEMLLSEWEKILNNSQFDFSQKLYFFEKYLHISFDKLGLRYSELNLNSNEYLQGKRKDFYFLAYLSIKDMWCNPTKWGKEIWEAMEKLSDTEYLSVLTANNFIKLDKLSFDFDDITMDKVYNLNNKNEYEEVIQTYVKPELDRLSKKGYKFNFQK
ncbi:MULTISPECIES: P-loop NTPase fold protein [Lactobacillales]|uniref:P-loop NTPase fold protein n=1 Tax=Lactobacillales TaxID=186826 RepID=UPI0006609D84|nr:P-loop NTPase fold protein [Carnobacterium sp. 1290_CSPC]